MVAKARRVAATSKCTRITIRLFVVIGRTPGQQLAAHPKGVDGWPWRNGLAAVRHLIGPSLAVRTAVDGVV